MNPRRFWKSLFSAYLQLRYFHIFGVPSIKLRGVCDLLDASQMWHPADSRAQHRPKELLTKKKRRKRFLIHSFGCRICFFRKSLQKIFDSIDWWGLMIKCFSCAVSPANMIHPTSSHVPLTCCQVFPALPAPTPAPAPGAFTGVSTAGCWMTCHDLLRHGQPRNWAGRGWHSATGGDACFGAGFIRWGFQWFGMDASDDQGGFHLVDFLYERYMKRS